MIKRDSVATGFCLAVLLFVRLAGFAGEQASNQALLKQAREALAASRLSEADRIADDLLVASPGDRDAVGLKIDVLLARNDAPGALRTLDRYAEAAKREDLGLLSAVARATLRAVAANPPIGRFRFEALLRLAASGDEAARKQMEAGGGGQRALTTEGIGPDVYLARLGDSAAQRRLGEMVQSQIPDKVGAINALKDSGAREQAYTLLPLLNQPDAVVKASAAEALGVLGEKRALAPLRALLDEPVPLVRIAAAVALRRLGDPSADTLLAALLRSEVPDVRLMSAQAYAGGKDRQWVDAVRPLLRDANTLTRLHAAELLATELPGETRTVVVNAAGDANAVIRDEASRLLEKVGWSEPRLLRRLLADSSPGVRIHAAGGVLAALTAANAPVAR